MATNNTIINFETQKETLKDLLKMFNNLKTTEQELAEIINNLERRLIEIDKMIAEHIKEWQHHDEVYAKQLIIELEQQGISLSELEKDALKRGLKTMSKVKKDIEAHKVKLPVKTTRFKVKAYASIIAALARTLNKIDSSVVNNVINKLKTTSIESEAAVVISKAQGAIYDDIRKKVKAIEKTLPSYSGLTKEQKQTLNRAIKTISPEITKAQKPLTPTPIIE